MQYIAVVARRRFIFFFRVCSFSDLSLSFFFAVAYFVQCNATRHSNIWTCSYIHCLPSLVMPNVPTLSTHAHIISGGKLIKSRLYRSARKSSVWIFFHFLCSKYVNKMPFSFECNALRGDYYANRLTNIIRRQWMNCILRNWEND